MSTVPTIAPDAAAATDTRRIDRFLKLMIDRGASDLHLSTGRPPLFRLSGEMDPVRYRPLTEADFVSMEWPRVRPALWAECEETRDIALAYQRDETGRLRVNVFRQARVPGAVFRVIRRRILSIEQLGLPPQVARFAKITSGLVLVTG